MSVARRNFHVPPDGQRCNAIAKSAAGNPDGRCMRRRLPGFDLCTQHLKVGAEDRISSTYSRDRDVKPSTTPPCDPLVADLIRTMIEAGFSKREAKDEVQALVKWARKA